MNPGTGNHAGEEIIIEAGRTEGRYWHDVWRYRELFYFLAWRDILVRYKQTAIGIAWSILRPLTTMVVFTLVFGTFAGLPSQGAPYPVMVYAAMLPWQFFATALTDSSNSLVSNSNLLSKVYFPRLIVPSSSIIVCVVDFLISLALLFLLMCWYGVLPHWRILTLPLFFLLALFFAFGSGLLLAALNVKYHDFRYVVPFIVQFGLYVSPVGFSSSVVPEQWRLIYSLNPMVGVIDGFRWAILGGGQKLHWQGLMLATAGTALLLVIGIRYFRKTEQAFADII
ncbi:ABC transporter permease [Geobacter hydrogenophilus]|uniref:Transport permease protein n=1 Tax=Geobacter hydrogenophilus TaxID=40983 RepID=A0A9W6FX17_9BACT|nr:ABC transporter permease [Geobacter hydrogenophilus]GLI36605.1 transport permease protein [Geobacter hydrogenophilus]